MRCSNRNMYLKLRLVLSCLAASVGVGLWAQSMAWAEGSQSSALSVIWAAAGPEQVLKTWEFPDLSKLKQTSSHEKDPASGKLTRYKGVLLSQVLEAAMNSLSVEHKALVDLVIFKNASGGQVLLPRSVITKYPVLLALDGPSASLVIPWTSKPKVLREDLPVESYFISNVKLIELSNYRDRYASVFLKRRTDPLAMRGEKLFVQNCVGCHAGANKPTVTDLSGEAKARRLASDGHPAQVKGVPRLNDRDRRALVNYLDAYRTENSTSGKGGATQAGVPTSGLAESLAQAPSKIH